MTEAGGVEGPRIAVVVPRHRTWSWHEKAIALLRGAYQIDVFTNAEAAPYPAALRAWLGLEGALFARASAIERSRVDGPRWPPPCGATRYSLIIDLSEAGVPDPEVRVLRPEFDGSADSLRMVATLIAQNNPYLSFRLAQETKPIVASYLAMEDRDDLSGRLQLSFGRLAVLTLRAAHEVLTGSRHAVLPEPPKRPAVSDTTPAWIVALIASLGGKILRRMLRPLRLEHHWSTALLRQDECSDPTAVADTELEIVPDDRRHFYADPFLLTDNGRTWLFVEDLEYRTAKGAIACAEVKSSGGVATPTPVLVRPYHLSYPFVFRDSGAIYMIPETAQNRTVELYRAEVFPSDWVLVSVLLQDIKLADATLLQHQGRWWMFGAVSHDGGSSQDELAIFFSDRLEGPWRPHAANPVKSDCRSARPAGGIVKANDRLLRPAQDCEAGYGSGLVWLEIVELTPTRFREVEVTRWGGDSFLPADGIHTFNRCQNVAAIDVKRTVWKWSWPALTGKSVRQ